MPSAIEIPWSRYIPHEPTPRQHAFLWLSCKEAFFGGAAGGGKSDALLMGALQYVDVPGYAAIIFRKTYTDLSLPGAIMSRAEEWLANTDARWNNNDKEFVFPSGAKLTFAYLKGPQDKYRYQSAEFQFLGFDEITQFEQSDYTYLLSRLRRPADGPLALVPLRSRTAANPGGVGHRWVKERFVDGRSPERVFIPSRLDDNPHLDRETYEQSLSLLDPVEYAQLRHGDWSVRPAGYYIWDSQHIAAASDLGRRYELEAPGVPDNEVNSGIDFGDFQTVQEIIIHTERGGIWVPNGEIVDSRVDLEAISNHFYEAIEPYLVYGPWKEARYDSSFKQSARTVGKMLEKKLGRPNPVLKTGRPSMYPASFGDYKDISIKYIRLLLRNTAEEQETRIIAISPGNKVLLQQMEDYQGKEIDPEKPEKGNDDAVDALIAGATKLARKHRILIEKLEQEAKKKAGEPINEAPSLYNIPPEQRA